MAAPKPYEHATTRRKACCKIVTSQRVAWGSFGGLGAVVVKTRRWECDRPGVEPTSSGCIVWGQYCDSTTHLKRSAVMSGTGIHRLIYRDVCVERGASYAACCSQQLFWSCVSVSVSGVLFSVGVCVCVAC